MSKRVHVCVFALLTVSVSSADANGSYSPHSTVNGTPTPSPPALSSPPTHALDASASAGAGARDTHRQISKVRPVRVISSCP